MDPESISYNGKQMPFKFLSDTRQSLLNTIYKQWIKNIKSNGSFSNLKSVRIQNLDKLAAKKLNSNSLVSKFDELKALSWYARKVDILKITETKVDKTFFFQTFFSLNRFSQPIRQDRNHNEGDIMIYVRGVIPRKKTLNLWTYFTIYRVFW